jgi:transketolase
MHKFHPMGLTGTAPLGLRDQPGAGPVATAAAGVGHLPARQTADRIRHIILDQSKRAHVGHIGSALSVADIVAALYAGALRVRQPDDPDRDRFILSKGHAALAVYAALYLRGWLTEDDLNTFCADGSLLGVHPEHELRGVDFSTGSLGQGLSVGAGAALAARLQWSSRRVFVLVSDAECNEGALWEAVMFAAHHQLSNLVAVIDVNGQQALGYTRDVLDLSPLADRWRAFGWDVREVDGHDPAAMAETVNGLGTNFGPPHALVARTVFGKGVSFMENHIKWHYSPMSGEEYRQAREEIGGEL